MKKIMIVALLVALVAGVWTPMVQADAKADLQQAGNIAGIVKGFAGTICNQKNPATGNNDMCPSDVLTKVKMVIDLGSTSLITAATLSQTADQFPNKTRKAIADLQLAAAGVNTASIGVKNAKTAQDQIDTLMTYLNAQGKFIGVIADYLDSLESDIFNPIFSLIEAMPFVGSKVVIDGKPVSLVVGNMLSALKKRNDTFLKAVSVLPTVIKSVEAAATGGTAPATAAPVVKGEEFGF
ncbi:MAG: hypothetical protein ACHQVS_00915 [Candidatus Babeliales bacterium]